LEEEWIVGVQKSERLQLLNAESKYNVFRLIRFSQVELENMFLILVSLRKIVFLCLIFSPCQGLKANLEMFGIKN
jgi:hypothetical protein